MSTLYIFIDEGGNFDFSNTGSDFFTLTCVSMRRPFLLHTQLDTYKYDLIEHSIKPRIEMEFFHCADDNMFVRKRVFELLAKELLANSVDTVVVEKRKTGPALQMAEKFYPRMLGYLLRFVLEKTPEDISELVIITDTIPVNKKRRAVEKALKLVLAKMLPKATPYKIMHHASRSHYGLQIADYVNWAILRKWERKDSTAYDQIKHLVRSEFDIFRTGTRYYY
ncbi:DUF3800 domain-containing protein [Yoonia sp. SS1-5]|uniref:DUF3800 domain-containing protein n=1 Tax=Yoonia rhodophyticola TaxID=3137370 RepID=A0AAN0MCQ0_9RHOB